MLLLTVMTGCQALAAPPASTTPAAPRISADPTAPAAAAEGLASLPETLAAAPVSVSLEAPASPIAVAPCAATADKKGYYGFYSSDAWDKGHVVLTFDDGPHPTATPRVLDLLAKEQMKATFFLVGRNINRDTYPLVQRMVADGHTLGSHSYTHDVKMTNVSTPKETVEEIRGQHEVTSIMIDLALLARSADDFDAMFRQVFQRDPAVWLTGSVIRAEWRADLARHVELLASRGFGAGARPYAVLYSRPPGGGPYVEHDGAAGIKLYDAALEKLGMMNVLWHGASGDTVPGQRGDYGFLTSNIDKYAKSGGVILIHDYIRADALTASLDKIAKDPSLEVISMSDAVQHKYACSTQAMGLELANAAAADVLSRGFLALQPIAPSSTSVALAP
jgi:peptidoglycan/xylan/chitin deacetylase (PgdA/CDA1 family)